MRVAAADRAYEFLQLASVTRDDVWKFWNRLDTDAERSSGALLRRFGAIVVCWIAAYGVTVEAVQDANFGVFKIVDVSYLMLLAPLVVAVLCHDLAALVALSTARAVAERAIFAKLFPDATPEHRYVITVSSRTTIMLERLLSHRLLGHTSAILDVGSIAVLAACVLVPVGAFIHTFLIAAAADAFYAWSRSLTIVVALLMFLRAVGVFGVALVASRDAG
jgi:hypothetical protein